MRFLKAQINTCGTNYFVCNTKKISETNLKDRQALPDTKHLVEENGIAQLVDCQVKCELPNNQLYQFNGSLRLRDKTYPLALRQTVLRVKKET